MLILSAFGSLCQKTEGHTCSQLLGALPADQVLFLFEESAENDSATAGSANFS